MIGQTPRTHIRMVAAIAVALAAAILMLFAGFCVSGAGEGWTIGAFSSLPLAVVSFGSVYCALIGNRRRKLVVVLFTLGLFVCLAAAIATLSGEQSYFDRLLTHHFELFVLFVLSCLIWVIASLTVLLRTPPSRNR